MNKGVLRIKIKTLIKKHTLKHTRTEHHGTNFKRFYVPKNGWHHSTFLTVLTYFCFNSVLITPTCLLIGPRGN